ncbi:MAG TPA: hypothetical protein P5080_02850 [Candidatus Paceibacterota bacterium]|nr:hypothetical protein [Candidatus Pacearchaeota archaeon]HRZ50907.1 hypothetical protein [Candidatus Paceibacterota bacterium]HSA36628.1 hypothetical protein [Candidatus Paceibacterota bacterium]
MVLLFEAVEAAKLLLDMLSNIADAYRIEIGFRRAKDMNRKYSDMNEEELHIQLICWYDEGNFWSKLPDRITLPDKSGLVDKSELFKLTDDYRLAMLRICSSTL